MKPGFNNAFTIGIADGFGPFERCSGLILVPVRFSALVAFEPFEKPVFGPIKVTVDALG
jgi:hypothetical protein